MKISLGLIISVLSGAVEAVEWLEVKDPDSLEIQEVASDHSMSFDNKTFTFYYTIKRDSPLDRKPGAILVQVEKHYADNEPVWREGIRSTLYWRGQFPEPAKDFGEDVRLTLRSTFERFHTFGTGSIELRNDFHASIPPSWQTSEPNTKLQSFRFSDSDDDKSIQSAKLIYYDGIAEGGSRLNFYVIAQDAFEEMTITITELNPLPGTPYATKTVRIGNARQ